MGYKQVLFAITLLFGLCLTATTLEIKVVNNDLPYEGSQLGDPNQLRLAINFNAKYVYPANHNTFTL